MKNERITKKGRMYSGMGFEGILVFEVLKQISRFLFVFNFFLFQAASVYLNIKVIRVMTVFSPIRATCL